ncbi:MAG: type VI secretion protein ImpB [Nitratireductor sp.]
MRKPETIECLYLDFDGFFASVEQQAKPRLRNRPVGIVPFDNTQFTCVIACSKEAKAFGCKNVMKVKEAKERCPHIVLVPQNPDLYRRAHNTLIAEINAVLPVEAVKSIDEITCRLDATQRLYPQDVSDRIKQRIARYVGPYITCSIGFAANRQLAKIAGKQNKPDGTTIWTPEQVPKVLHSIPFDDIPGIGSRMTKRLNMLGIYDMQKLLALPPKHMRKIWRSVTGERLWYALHGYAIHASKSDRGMFGHGRVLPPDARSVDEAYQIGRMLLIKAARRMRKAGYYSSRLYLWCGMKDNSYSDSLSLPIVNDDQAVLNALKILWGRAKLRLPANTRIVRIGVTLGDLTIANTRQLDMLLNDDEDRQKWERVTNAIDAVNRKYSQSLVTLGPWTPPSGGHLGGKISYTRIPRAEDFW